MAFWMGLSMWVSTSCLCVVHWMALMSVFRCHVCEALRPVV